MVRGFWNETYLNEICHFPMSKIKDQVDASSRAFGELIGLEHEVLLAPPTAIEPEDLEDEGYDYITGY